MRRAYWVWAGVILACFFVDRVSRTLAFAKPSQVLIPNLLTSTPTTNQGIALGIHLPMWATYSLVILLLGVVAYIAYSSYRRHAIVAWVACLAIASGAFSNVLDRIVYGHVRDFLKVSFWPTTGNVGDWCITIGSCVLILASMPRRHTRTTPVAK